MGDRKIRKEIKKMVSEKKVVSVKELSFMFGVDVGKMCCLVGDVLRSGLKFKFEV